MAFIKIVKNNAYFKRFQTKFRRRQEGKTDYYARKRLITQDKDKYNTPKYRLVVRRTCSKIICQIVYTTIKNDKVLTSAESTELRRFGLTAGLSNYAASYATGLLVARRLLKQVKMDTFYAGNTKVDGTVYNVGDTPNEERRPFKVILDIGLIRTTIGNRSFGALKGAADGGLFVPHNEKKFPGYHPAEEGGAESSYDPKAHKERIFGIHVDNYMKKLKGESQKAYDAQFSKWDKCLKEAKADSVEKLMTKIHAEIRKNPDRVKRGEKKNPKRDHKKFHKVRLTLAQRKKNVMIKLAHAKKAAGK